MIKKLDIEGRGMTSQRTRDRLISLLREKGITDNRVLAIMQRVPRHLFVDEAMASRSYENTALPIGHGQTISQPYTVARMTELLIQETIPENVLEVGTGSGYQAAILGGLVKRLHTVEVIPELYKNARDLLYNIGYRNIHTHQSDGSWGWIKKAPFDAIIATAAPEKVPDSLLQQLKIGGVMVIPVGQRHQTQQLQTIHRLSEDNYKTTIHESVQFVPFVTK
jgi:protein-L-isoaspartate(D-aspartate) O-methyltransferase